MNHKSTYTALTSYSQRVDIQPKVWILKRLDRYPKLSQIKRMYGKESSRQSVKHPNSSIKSHKSVGREHTSNANQHMLHKYVFLKKSVSVTQTLD